MIRQIWQKIKSERGSITLESAFVVPLVIFTVCLSVYIALILFEQAQLQTSSNYAAQSVSASWLSVLKPDADGGGGVAVPADGAGLYHRNIDFNKAKKLDVAAAVAASRLNDVNISGYAKTKATAVYKNSIFGKTLTVGLDSQVTVPNKNVTSAFGLSNEFFGEFAAKSLIPDFAENIRCISYVQEIVSKLEEVSPEFAQITGGFTGLISKIQEFVGGLL